MTIKEKLEKIAYAPVNENDFMVITTNDYFYNLCKEAYNLGVEEAANNTEADIEWIDDYAVGEYPEAIVNREAILKLKL